MIIISLTTISPYIQYGISRVQRYKIQFTRERSGGEVVVQQIALLAPLLPVCLFHCYKQYPNRPFFRWKEDIQNYYFVDKVGIEVYGLCLLYSTSTHF